MMDTVIMNDKKYTFAIHTLGCKVNTYESDVIAERMKKAGFDEVGFEDFADIYIINTCTVTNIADRKSRQMLHRAKKQNPAALLVATGCYVDAVEQEKGLPEDTVDIWVNNSRKADIAGICLEKLSLGTEKHDDYFLSELDGHTRAFVKVEDGCNMFCSYCIIPYVRGKVTPRPVEDTIREVSGLRDRGVTEIVITGIHLSSMGPALLETIKRINELDGIKRIRLGSLEPRLITKEFVSELSGIEKLCHHFHLSLQSGCDQILKSMNRRYTTAEFENSCRLLREAFPDVAITTDIIVGFPGETEENFRESLLFAEKIGFYEAHVFKYSRRKGTVADTLPGQLTDAVKGERSAELIRKSEELSHAFRERFVGRRVSFLAEEKVMISGTGYVTGYTGEYVRCMMEESLTGEWRPGEIISGYAAELCNDGKEGEYLLSVKSKE